MSFGPLNHLKLEKLKFSRAGDYIDSYMANAVGSRNGNVSYRLAMSSNEDFINFHRRWFETCIETSLENNTGLSLIDRNFNRIVAVLTAQTFNDQTEHFYRRLYKTYPQLSKEISMHKEIFETFPEDILKGEKKLFLSNGFVDKRYRNNGIMSGIINHFIEEECHGYNTILTISPSKYATTLQRNCGFMFVKSKTNSDDHLNDLTPHNELKGSLFGLFYTKI